MGKLKVHIRDPLFSRPYCDSRVAKPPMAKPGRAVNCKVCLRLLYHNAQYYNQLLKAGYTFPQWPLDQLSGQKKVDPRQTDFMWED